MAKRYKPGETLAVADLDAYIKQLKDGGTKPHVVQGPKDAKRLTAVDPLRREWAIGDKYYIMMAPVMVKVEEE